MMNSNERFLETNNKNNMNTNTECCEEDYEERNNLVSQASLDYNQDYEEEDDDDDDDEDEDDDDDEDENFNYDNNNKNNNNISPADQDVNRNCTTTKSTSKVSCEPKINQQMNNGMSEQPAGTTSKSQRIVNNNQLPPASQSSLRKSVQLLRSNTSENNFNQNQNRTQPLMNATATTTFIKPPLTGLIDATNKGVSQNATIAATTIATSSNTTSGNMGGIIKKKSKKSVVQFSISKPTTITTKLQSEDPLISTTTCTTLTTAPQIFKKPKRKTLEPTASNFPDSFRVISQAQKEKSIPNIDGFKARLTKLRQRPPKISAKSWVILNGRSNKKMIAGVNETHPREIASLTKMMTCYIVSHYIRVLELIPENTFFKVSEHAASQPGTSAELKEGSIVSVIDLLHGMMLPSGNDAAVVLAENFGVYLYMQSANFREKYGNIPSQGSKKKKFKVKNPISYFVREMNAVAERLNMNDTFFTNPHGLMQKKNRSTAFDVALLSYQLTYDPFIRDIVNREIYTATIRDESMHIVHPQYVWRNTNRMLKKDGYFGLKTGITPAAGPCLASWYKDEKYNFIVILLASKSLEDRWAETNLLVEWAIKQIEENAKESLTVKP